jgi:hypothetical protein
MTPPINIDTADKGDPAFTRLLFPLKGILLETRIKARGWDNTDLLYLLQLTHLLHTFPRFLHIYNKQLLAVTGAPQLLLQGEEAAKDVEEEAGLGKVERPE